MPEPVSWKILMIDDDEDDYVLVRDMLAGAQHRKFSVQWASSYASGRAALLSTQFDAVLMDYDIKGFKGIDLIREANGQKYPGAFILYTGRGSYEVDLEAMQAGASMYLTKGETSALMLERGIRYAIERKRSEQVIEASLREQTRLASFPELNPNPIAEIDLAGTAHYVNPHGRKLFPDLQEKGIRHPFLAGWEEIQDHVHRHPQTHYTREIQVEGHYYQQSIYFYEEYQLVRIYGMDITQRVKAEQSLEATRNQAIEEKNRLQAVMEVLPVGVAITDEQGGSIQANRTYEQLWGGPVRPAENVSDYVAYQAWWSETGTPLQPEEWASAQAVQKGEDVRGQLLEIQRFDGKRSHVINSASPVRDSTGKIIGSAVAIQDITELHGVQQALRESERQMRELAQSLEADRARLAAVLESLPVGVWIADEKGRMLIKNKQADRIWAGNAPLAEDADQYKEYRAWFAKGGREPSTEEYPMIQALRTGQPAGPVEFNIHRFDGTVGTVLVSAAPIQDSRGEMMGVVGINLDITERKRVEEALRESEQKYRDLVQYAPAGIYEIDFRTQRFVSVNDVMCRLLGYSREELLQMNPLALLDEPSQHRFQERMRRWLAEEKLEENVEYRVLANGGREIFAVLNVTFTKDEQGKPLGATVVGYDVTERKQATNERERLLEENRQQRAFLERLIQNVPIAIAVLNGPEHRYTLANPHQEFLSRGKGHLIGRTVAEVWAEGPEQVLPLLDRVYQSGEPYTARDVLFHIVRDQGLEEAYFDVSYLPLRDPEGQVEGILALAVETTEQVARRAELDQQKNLLQAIFDHAPVGIAVVEGPDLIYRMANQSYQAIPGKIELPLLGHPAAEMFPDAVAAGGLKYLQSALETGQANTLAEFAMPVSLDGRETWWRVSHIPLPDAQGKVNQVLIISLDLTAEVVARKALEVEQARLLAIINNAPTAIVVADDRARILMSNEVANQLYARPVPLGQEYSSHAMLQICYPDGTPYEPRDLPLTRSALDGETFSNEELLIVWPGEQRRPLLVNTAPVRDSAGRITGAVGVFQDISRIKQAESALEQYALQLEKTNRDLHEFVYIASHDLQEPLHKIESFSELLFESAGAGLTEQEREYLGRMQSASSRMSRMIEDLLVLAQVTTHGKPFQEVDLDQAAKTVVDDLEVLLQQTGGQVELGNLPVIRADATQIHQLLLNLIGNGLKFHQPGVPPVVKVQARQTPNQWVEISIEDNGIGFNQDSLNYLFQPFHRLHAHLGYEGSGIGLSICRKIVERHGGEICAQSEPGKGSVFTVRLPQG